MTVWIWMTQIKSPTCVLTKLEIIFSNQHCYWKYKLFHAPHLGRCHRVNLTVEIYILSKFDDIHQGNWRDPPTFADYLAYPSIPLTLLHYLVGQATETIHTPGTTICGLSLDISTSEVFVCSFEDRFRLNKTFRELTYPWVGACARCCNVSWCFLWRCNGLSRTIHLTFAFPVCFVDGVSYKIKEVHAY